MIVGISGYRRNATIAVGGAGNVLAVCEQGRVTRVRDIGIQQFGFPEEAFAEALAVSGVERPSITRFVTAEREILQLGVDTENIDHHFGHAAAVYCGAGTPHALIAVADSSNEGLPTLWEGDGDRLTCCETTSPGLPFTRIFSRLVRALGFRDARDEYEVEALARSACAEWRGTADLFEDTAVWDERTLQTFESRLADAARTKDLAFRATVAAGVTRHLGERLVAWIGEARHRFNSPTLGLGGGLFFNTHFTSVVRDSGLFEDVYVPVNPGNAGLAVGCVLGAAPLTRSTRRLSPFLGAGFDNERIKPILDNCKVGYSFLPTGQVLSRVVDTLIRGRMVAWFQGRAEVGPRSLGARSIFASPLSPHVRENLNTYLKHRAPYRSYGLMVRSDDVGKFFHPALASPHMEGELRVRDPELFRNVGPTRDGRIRVQTVRADSGEPELAAAAELLRLFGAATGVPVLVNTSLNGLHEPTAWSPRDAVRVFYGSGLDQVAIGNFLLSK